ncbi:MAG TPA: hypothetical protein VFR27_07555 [Mycobacterium sp.]|nr:hypothetical protein [Mycobacterium sp.]
MAAPALRRDVEVLVTGPRLAGVSAVAQALRDRLPDRAVVESLADGAAPAAVVFVVSAAAALTESDCALLDTAAARTDAVIGVVSKIDIHRHWPQMLRIATGTLIAYAPRYRDVSWVAVAAAPALGQPRIDALVAEVGKPLLDATVQRRNRLREWEFQLQATVRGCQRDTGAASRRARISALQQQRDTALRQQRLTKAERTVALRSRVAQARVRLVHIARNHCSALRAELHDGAAALARHRLAGFEAHARSRVAEVTAEVDRFAAAYLAEVAHELGMALDPPPAGTELPQVGPVRPAVRPRRLETQLMLLLGGGFGLGMALTASRLFGGLTAGLTAAGAATCAAVGLAATVWVVRARGLLHDRALLDRWVMEVTAALRCTVEELVALRALSAETALTAALAERNEADGTRLARRIAVLDGERRTHVAAAARAGALRDRQMPVLQRALAAVRAELETPG